MEKILSWMKKKKIVLSMILALVVLAAAVCVFIAIGNNQNDSIPALEGTANEAQEASEEAIRFLKENGIFSGIEGASIEVGSQTELKSLMTFNKIYVKDIEVNDDAVDYQAEGTYEIVCTILFDPEAWNEFLAEKNALDIFGADQTSVIVKDSVTVAGTGDSAEENKPVTEESAAESEGNTGTTGTSQSETSVGNGSSGSGNRPSSGAGSTGHPTGGADHSHEHVWVTKTWTEQRPTKVQVTHEKKEYTLYRMYWYNTGKWEETRDSKRFSEWSKDEYGAWFTTLHPYDKPEDNPLFIGYDESGHETYRNDHAIVRNLFEWVPCEPYEKTEMTTVEVTTITCSICGAVK